MPILGIVDSSKRVSTDTGAMFPLQVVTVGASGASSVTFSNIPSTYAHLQIRGIFRGTRNATATGGNYFFNGDTGANYSNHQLYGDGSSAGSWGEANSSYGNLCTSPASTALANVFGTVIFDVLDYASTNKYKTIRSFNGVDLNGTGTSALYSSSWRNTVAVTSITLSPAQDSWAQYTQFALYGVKSA